MGLAVTGRGVGKRFRCHGARRPTTLREALLHGGRWFAPADSFWALRDVSFAVNPGRTMGLIGANGAGKSTLLRLIGGVGKPDEGRIEVRGQVGALLDLSSGMHPDLTGRENTLLSGMISGLTRREVTRRFEAIVSFAELEAWIDDPVRTYSSGMRMRLAFAVASQLRPDILLVDEVLAVGDQAFQRKCLDRIGELKADGCTIVLVSHDLDLVRELCDQVLWLRAGRVAADGPADAVVGQYLAETLAESRRRTPSDQPVVQTATGTELRLNENRFGSLEMRLARVELLDRSGQPVAEIDSGDSLRICLEYIAPESVPSPIFSIAITRDDGLVCYTSSTAAAGVALPTLRGSGSVSLEIDRLDLQGGEFRLDVGVYEREWAYAYDYHVQAYPLRIRSDVGGDGCLRPPARWVLEASRPGQPVAPAAAG